MTELYLLMFSWQEMFDKIPDIECRNPPELKKKVISRVLTYVVLKKINLFNIWHEKYVMVLIQI